MTVPVLKLERTLLTATFLERKNRFLSIVELDGVPLKAHVHDPGRLKELLYPGNSVLVASPSRSNSKRKTQLDVMFARYDEDWILVNSAFHRPISQEILKSNEVSPFPDIISIIPEVSYKKGTRFDYLVTTEQGVRCYIEVKGCTLEDEEHTALFPDAPTARGARHLRELLDVVSRGLEAMIMFLILRPSASCFSPNVRCDPVFSEFLRECLERGVRVQCKRIAFKDGWFIYTGDIPVRMMP